MNELTTSLLLFCAATTFAAGLVIAQRRLLAHVARRFARLPRVDQTLFVVAVCVMTVCAQKSGTNEVAGAAGAIFNAEVEEAQRRGEEAAGDTSASPNLLNLRVEDSQATNVFSITFFSVDRVNCAVSFAASWTSNLFGYADSRNVDLFSSTNLLERRWTPLGALAMPDDTNACVFVVTSNDVSAATRPQFLDTFAGLGFFRFGLDFDSDGDGLTDAYESLVTLTDPRQPDTDGDGLNDGWESRYQATGFDPLTDNATDGNPDNDASADLDGDGVTNGEECARGLNPANADTDGDGVGDGAEIAQNSDPNDATDGGEANSRVPLQFVFGDPSFSHSEKYRLAITPKAGVGERPSSFSWLNEHYGECELKTAWLKPGWCYEVRLRHAGTNGTGEGFPDYDYALVCLDALTNSLPSNVVIDDPDSLFGVDDTSDSFGGAEKVATVSVYAVTSVTICDPDDSSWSELDAGRVILDDESFRAKVEVSPQLTSLDQCCEMFGDALTIKTSGTCPAGANVAIPDDAVLVNMSGKSEVRITKTRERLKASGLLPTNDEDGVDEMAWLDMANLSESSGQDLSDSLAFAALGYADRGRASNDLTQTLESSHPNSAPTESYFKAAGREIVTAEYAGVESKRRQIMNQADYFYFSGHGNHATGAIQGGFTPSMAAQYWNRDLNVAIIAGCSVLDVNDYNNLFPGASHTLSPGKAWAQTGPKHLLGYAAKAPGDAGGAPTRIVQSWVSKRAALGDIEAWMQANRENHAWNACAIEKDKKYIYFLKITKGFYIKWSVEKEKW